MQGPSCASPFRINGSLAGLRARPIESLLEHLSGLRTLERAYDRHARGCDVDAFVGAALHWLRATACVDEQELTSIPRAGGTIVVANHPFGALDGLLLAQLLRRIRPDVRFLANSMLARIPELAPLLIGVDPFGGERARAANMAPLRQAVQWVRQGGLLVIFPAGEVSHWQRKHKGIADPDWHSAAARIVARTKAPVVPVYIAGRNSFTFQLASLIHPRMRTLLLARELLNKAGRTVRIRIGHAVQAEWLAGLAPEELLALLRLRCYALADTPGQSAACAGAELAPPGDPTALAAEVAALKPSACLLSQGPLSVYCADAQQIPQLLQEIGRLREITFRAAGEGTGRSRDIDLYDSYYRHLFVWNRERKEVVGAYRLGEADRIVAKYGHRRLYTRSLFHYGRNLLGQLNPALELGRTFIRPEYQRQFAPLLLLWKGIGAFVAANPRYKVLFGPVSISADYGDASRQLIVDFLRAHNQQPELARQVRPRRRFKSAAALRAGALPIPSDLEQVSRLLEQLERDGKGMPILLRQYLKLGGKVLGFNVDPAFANALDALIMVDLTRTDPKVLVRYMGEAGAARFLAYQRTVGGFDTAAVAAG